MARKIKLNNEKILKALQKKEAYVAELQVFTDEAEKLQERFKQIDSEVKGIMAKAQRKDESIKPEIIREIEVLKADFTEFEEFSRVYIENDEIFVEIADRLEEFKEYYKQKKDEQSKQNNGSDPVQGDGNTEDNTK